MKAHDTEILRPSQVSTNEAYGLLETIYESSAAFSYIFKDKYPTLTSLGEDLMETNTGNLNLFIRAQSQLVGFLFLKQKKATHLRHTADFSMGVLPEFTGQGLAKLLMKSLLELRSADIEIIELMVRANNEKAIHLYEKFDFKKVALLKQDTKIGDEYFDGILMRRSFIKT